ncbi:MAG: MFS transporter [Rhodobacterales bacterium]|nr:MFS transporter [Rhodobacterales bacterium]
MTATSPHAATDAAYVVIFGVALGHLLNDVMQSLVTAIYPLLQVEFSLDFWQIGLLSFAFQVTASILQPVIGNYTDKNPMPQSLALGMGSTLVGIVLLAVVHSYWLLVLGAMLIGVGSAIFHPEASRVARFASGGRYGTAQSLFQVGGNIGTAVGPLLAAFIVVPHGRPSLLWFSVGAMLGIVLLRRVGSWYSRYRTAHPPIAGSTSVSDVAPEKVRMSLIILALLVFSKNIYTASFSSYYTFFLIERFDLSAQQSQLMLFVFLAAMAVGVMIGGPIGDRFGARTVIWFSILGILPFTLALPYVGLIGTGVLTVVIGVILASAFPAILVFAQELVPGRIGMINGLFFGFAFGMGGVAAAVLGVVADWKGLEFVFFICSWLPVMGLLTIFLPRNVVRPRQN